MPNVYYRDRDSDVLGWGLVILAIVIIAAAAMFVFARNQGDVTTIETVPMTPPIQDVQPAPEPIVIDRPVIEHVPVPVPVEKTIIREVPVPAPSDSTSDNRPPAGSTDTNP